MKTDKFNPNLNLKKPIFLSTQDKKNINREWIFQNLKFQDIYKNFIEMTIDLVKS